MTLFDCRILGPTPSPPQQNLPLPKMCTVVYEKHRDSIQEDNPPAMGGQGTVCGQDLTLSPRSFPGSGGTSSPIRPYLPEDLLCLRHTQFPERRAQQLALAPQGQCQRLWKLPPVPGVLPRIKHSRSFPLTSTL